MTTSDKQVIEEYVVMPEVKQAEKEEESDTWTNVNFRILKIPNSKIIILRCSFKV